MNTNEANSTRRFISDLNSKNPAPIEEGRKLLDLSRKEYASDRIEKAADYVSAFRSLAWENGYTVDELRDLCDN